MKRIRVFIINYLGYTKTEANATVFLIITVVLFAILPRVYLQYIQRNTPVADDYTDELKEWLSEIESNVREKEIEKKAPIKPERFKFDPNLATEDQFKKLGFKPYIASRISSYRAAGGTFKTREDLKKIYGIDTSLVADLSPFIVIPPPKVTPHQEVVKSSKMMEEPEPTVLQIDLNRATEEELQQIKGIGPFYSKNIVAYRQKLGGYYNFEQLHEVYRMRPKVIELLKSHCYIQDPDLRKLPINSDSIRLIALHPYLSWNQARVIVNYRHQHGAYTTSEQLLDIKIIPDSLFQKISPYISVEP